LEQPEQTVYFPVFQTIDEQGKSISPRQIQANGRFVYNEEVVDTDGIYNWLREMDDIFPAMPSFKVLQTYLKPVCCESLIDPMVYHYLSLESAVEAYGADALDLPMDLFKSFEEIRSSKNLFQNLQNFEQEQELKSKTK